MKKQVQCTYDVEYTINVGGALVAVDESQRKAMFFWRQQLTSHVKNKENKSFVKIHNDTMEPPNNNVVQVTRNRKNPQDMPTGIVDVIQKLELLSTTEEEMPDTLKMKKKCQILLKWPWSQSFTSLIPDLRQNIVGVSSFDSFLNGKFPCRNFVP